MYVTSVTSFKCVHLLMLHINMVSGGWVVDYLMDADQAAAFDRLGVRTG